MVAHESFTVNIQGFGDGWWHVEATTTDTCGHTTVLGEAFGPADVLRAGDVLSDLARHWALYGGALGLVEWAAGLRRDIADLR